MQEQEQKKKIIESERENAKKTIEIVQQGIKQCTDDGQLVQLQAKLKEIELKKSELDAKTNELHKEVKKTPWNVDTISKPGFAKTIINTKSTKPSYDELSEDEKENLMKDFVEKNEKIIEQFGMLRRYDDSKKFLLDHSHLASEATANYLVIWCINLEMEKKSMALVVFSLTK